MILLKDGWKYNECDGIIGDLLVTVKDHFSSPQAPIFNNEPRRGGSCVIPENVRRKINMILLKDGWRYKEGKVIEDKLCVKGLLVFNDMAPPTFSNGCNKTGSEVAPENIKKELIGFPSEIIYSLWSVLQHGIVKEPLPFHDAYVHIPLDFNNRTNQLMLVYTLISVLLKEKNGNYTKGKIGFKKEVREDE